MTKLLRLSGIGGVDYWVARALYDLPHYYIIMAPFSFFMVQSFSPVYTRA